MKECFHGVVPTYKHDQVSMLKDSYQIHRGMLTIDRRPENVGLLIYYNNIGSCFTIISNHFNLHLL